MKDLNHKQTLGLVITTAILCGLFMFSTFIGEFLYSKVSSKPNEIVRIDTFRVSSGTDTIRYDMCSSCVHFETCIKCQRYEKELEKKEYATTLTTNAYLKKKPQTKK